MEASHISEPRRREKLLCARTVQIPRLVSCQPTGGTFLGGEVQGFAKGFICPFSHTGGIGLRVKIVPFLDVLFDGYLFAPGLIVVGGPV